MSHDTTTTEFGVARNGEVLGDTYLDLDTARQQLAFVTDTMKSIDLEPDVELVTVEVVTTYGAPVAWVDPAVEEVEAAKARIQDRMTALTGEAPASSDNPAETVTVAKKSQSDRSSGVE